ncbi:MULTISPECIES: hypothetical protein [unclassified Streptomyces]|uniref:hypothetical protein n=1 Tax=unclassified Streptomyces TaxID=2593676 RepID=UPI0022AE66D9|nr:MULTISPECIES: hypothetical protein [unclassified Streptomyces]MCZ4097312.1 hypothetical protein [Streptomyces sp. H39-C1]MCZ4120616.1 hypothetical protein [Streptomyces sp. H39-S7]
MAVPTAKKTPTAAAKKAEATGQPTEVEYKNITFLVESAKRLPLPVLEAIEDDRGELAIIRAIVGPTQWAKFSTTEPTIEDFEEFANLITQGAGFGDSGN